MDRLNHKKSLIFSMQLRFLPTFLVFFALSIHAFAAPRQDIFSLRVYQLKNARQEERVGQYLKNALVPALHRLGIAQVGVFTAVGNDTAAVRRMYVLMSFHSMDQFMELQTRLDKDAQYREAGKDYLEAAYDSIPYQRIETILLQAFPGMTRVEAPAGLTSPKAQRIYELRSYEGPTERFFSSKVEMFNKGDEIGLFKRLGFNAVFYASVISGAHMPNLMYMTSFDDMASREAHWKAFFEDPYWKQLVAQSQYQHNVSHADIIFLHPTDYSDL